MTVPKPGSPDALDAGCRCPVMDNAHGQGMPWPRSDGLDPTLHPSYWINGDCPLHGASAAWDGRKVNPHAGTAN